MSSSLVITTFSRFPVTACFVQLNEPFKICFRSMTANLWCMKNEERSCRTWIPSLLNFSIWEPVDPICSSSVKIRTTTPLLWSKTTASASSLQLIVNTQTSRVCLASKSTFISLLKEVSSCANWQFRRLQVPSSSSCLHARCLSGKKSTLGTVCLINFFLGEASTPFSQTLLINT